MTDNELFEIIERDWVHYCSKCEALEEIPWQSEGFMCKLVTYEGDLPEGGLSYDIMPSMMDRYRKFYITNNERLAYDVIMSVSKNLRIFVMYEPIYRSHTLENGKKVTQPVLAAALRCSYDQYKRQRARAKIQVIHYAKELAGIPVKKSEWVEGAPVAICNAN